jgi:hypothetical protein
MDIMCVTCNKAIFYNFSIVNLGFSKTRAYKGESCIPQNPKRKKRKNT